MKPWQLETIPTNYRELMTDEECDAIAPLVRTAPAMARALCMVEYSDNDDIDMCPACRHCIGHAADCKLDAALTAAGLDAAAREEVRRGT